MAEYIEKLLEEKSRGTACEILFTQWMLAKDYVPKVQSAIVRTFPHYSLHDASHSKTILDCIVRVLGSKAIDSLGPVDLWLLLAAAFYHDLGMIPSGVDIENVLKDDKSKFRAFIKACQSDESNPLYPFANVFEIKEDGIYFKDVLLNGSSYDSAHFLLAGFIRDSHALKSEDSLRSDDSVHLPGSPIPERLLDILGTICKVHSESFDNVMKLPRAEVGLGMDDCHPRFIACMLRIGDLLDLDNNRFSDVLLKTLPSIPKDSLLHKKKHLSIKHLRIDSERIEVTSKTDSYDVADITNTWLEMISDEFRRQRDVWQEIVPAGFCWYLPTVGELKVDLIGYDTIDGKKRPGFEIDNSKAISLLQGAGLYSSPAQCMRELLQNAVDATYLSIFQENSQGSPQMMETVEGFMDLCRKKEIKVSIKKTGTEGDKVVWHVCIEDRGIGMDKSDLGYLIRTGSKNQEKMNLIEKMPEYMRPSGTFGIGFQSVFLITDEVVIRTRKWDSVEEITAELYNPSGPRRGTVLVKTNPAVMCHGTRLEFDFRTEKEVSHWSVSTSQFYAMKTILSYDFVEDKTLDLEASRLLDEIATFSHVCPIPLLVMINGEKVALTRETSPSFDYYSSSNGLQLSLLPSDRHRSKIYFRNQIVEESRVDIPYVNVSVNLLAGNAKDLLTLNRNELQYQAREPVLKRIYSTLIELFKHKTELVPQEIKPLASMFLNEHCNDKIGEYPLLKDEWKNYKPVVYGLNKTKVLVWPDSFGDIVRISDGMPICWVCVDSESKSGVSVRDGFVVIKIYRRYSGDDCFDFLKKTLVKTHPFLANSIKKYMPKEKGQLLSVTQIDPILDWQEWINTYRKHPSCGRTIMPCNADYEVLRLRDDVSFRFASDRTFDINIPSKMICPYVREVEEGEWYSQATRLRWNDAEGELYRIVYDNRANPSVTLLEIQQTYQKFKDFLDPLIEASNKK